MNNNTNQLETNRNQLQSNNNYIVREMNSSMFKMLHKQGVFSRSFLLFSFLLFLLISHQNSNALNNPYEAPVDSIDDLDTFQNTPIVSPEAQALQQQQQLLQRASQPTNCENITNIAMCSHLAYTSTRMPNFYDDLNQIDASLRAQMLQDLVNSRCNPNIRNYICELLFPVCLDDRELMERFHIYPCKSFCRRLQIDCRFDIQQLIEKHGQLAQDMLMRTFTCDLLPFESNPGNETSSLSNIRGNVGPCHEITDIKNNNNDNLYNNNQIESGWNPYKPDRDKMPNILMINSNSDQEATSSILNALQSNPRLSMQDNNNNNNNNNNYTSHQTQSTKTNDKNKQVIGHIDNKQQQQQSLWYSNALFGLQSSMKFVSRYSEVIAILLVICLLLVLNSQRLHRLKSYFRLSSHSSSSSNNSSQSSSYRNQLKSHHLNHQTNKQLGINHFDAGSPGNPIVPESPSSSSRSLVMITTTSNNNNNNANLSHHLLTRQQLDTNDLSPPICDVTSEEIINPSKSLLIQGLAGQSQHKKLNNYVNNHQNHLMDNNHLLFSNNQRIGTRNQFGQARSTAVSDFDRELILSQVRGLANQLTTPNNNNNQQFFNTLDSSKSCISPNNNNNNNNHYDYISNSKEDLIIHSRSNQQQQAQLYSNILLSSPSHQVLLFDPPPQTGTTQQISQDDNINNNNSRNLRMLNNYHSQHQHQQIANSPVSYATPTISSDGPIPNGQQAAFDGRRQLPRVFEHQQQQQMLMRNAHKSSYNGGGSASGASQRSSKRRSKPAGHASLSSACSSAGPDSDSMLSGFASSSTPISLSRRQS